MSACNLVEMQESNDLLLRARACLLHGVHADTPLRSVHNRPTCPCDSPDCEASLRAPFPCAPLAPSLTQPSHTIDPCDLLVRLPDEGLRIREGQWKVIQLCWSLLRELDGQLHSNKEDWSAHASSLRLTLLHSLSACAGPLMCRHNEAWMLARTAAAMGAVLQEWVRAGHLPSSQPWLLDCVTLGATIATDSYVQACCAGKERVADAWQRAPASLSNWGEDAQERLYSCIEAELTCIASLAHAWWPVLPSHHCRRALGFLMDGALHALLERIWELRNIDDKQGRDLSRTIHRLLDGAAFLSGPPSPSLPALPEQGAYAAFHRGPAGEGGEDTGIAARYIRLWTRAGQIARILLADGTTMLAWSMPGGEIDSVGGVSRPEMARLVKALLHDSQERDALLEAVLKGAGQVPEVFLVGK